MCKKWIVKENDLPYYSTIYNLEAYDGSCIYTYTYSQVEVLRDRIKQLEDKGCLVECSINF